MPGGGGPLLLLDRVNLNKKQKYYEKDYKVH
jgi:hypothetical protein